MSATRRGGARARAHTPEKLATSELAFEATLDSLPFNCVTFPMPPQCVNRAIDSPVMINNRLFSHHNF